MYLSCSLEQVPITGRWRLIDESDALKDFDADTSILHLEKLKRKYKDRILPANHGITQKVRRITQDILKANDLGYMKKETGFCSVFYQLFGCLLQFAHASVAPSQSGKSGVPMDNDNREGQTRKEGLKNQEWEVIVVDDPEKVNVSALPGEEDIHCVYLWRRGSNLEYRLFLGTIVVYTGIFSLAKDEQTIAVVIGRGAV